MYSRQNRNPRADVSVDLPRDYSGSAFYPFPSSIEQPLRNPSQNTRDDEKPTECCDEEKKMEEECEKNVEVCSESEPIPCQPKGILQGLSGLLGGSIGLEELLLLGVIFLIFSDNDLRDNELLICLLLILFI